MNSYHEFLLYSQNYYNNYGQNHGHDHHQHHEQHTHHNEEIEDLEFHPIEERQRHVHEFEGSTKLAEENDERHNHRFAGVSGQAIPLPGGSHTHPIATNTDFFDHFHMIKVETGPAIEVGEGKHVHFVRGITSTNDGHSHIFTFATLVESPLLPNEC